MKIAVAYENGRVFQHFGHSQQFKIYTVENGEITASRVTDTNGSGHGALAGFLAANGVDTLICGGIGGGAQQVLAAAGIRLFGGVSGNADAAVMELIGGTLNFDPNVRCSHHDREHDGEVHRCGEHGCGEHHCEGSCGH
ncbi:MAG: NifB/NifX family molybdenum-iron cluster-binding protein [Acutalibacteraceae bacterium]